MTFIKLPADKVKIIGSIIEGPPNSVSGSPHLSVYPCNPEDIVDNPILLNQVVAAAIVASGATLSGLATVYSYDIVRVDGEMFDIDRHLLSTSGSLLLRRREIEKDFPEHHSSEIPDYYN